ncbi:MAG TPA: hypothetical protein VIV40_13035 [Kofleriaceae bacterium]
MSNHRFAYVSLFIITLVSSACTDDPTPSAPDATATVPIELAGHYSVTSTFSLSAPPPAAANVLAELSAMTDGPDDPSRYLIDLVIERLPDGATKTYATVIAPYIAAYVNQRLASVAPHFVDGSRALATGLARIAQHFGTSETFDIAADGPRVEGDDFIVESSWLSRTIVGLRFDLHAGRDVADVRFAPLGLADIATKSVVMLDATPARGTSSPTDQLAINLYTFTLPYTRLLRLGLDFAVIPDVVPGAHDLAQALVELVDCSRLGTVVSEYVGLGSPTFYATACNLGLSAAAARIYDRIAAIDATSLSIDIAGQAHAVDANGDGPMDAIATGTWTGTSAGVAISGNFDGSRQ